MKNIFKKLFNPEYRSLGLDELYSMTKYGSPKSEEQIKSRLINCIDDQIKNKVSNGNYTLILDLVGDVNKYQEYIIEYYDNLGLTAQIIKVELTKVNKTANYLLITWIK